MLFEVLYCHFSGDVEETVKIQLCWLGYEPASS